MFSEWKTEAGKNTEKFVPLSTFEDLTWLFVGTIGLCKSFLKEEKSRTLGQHCHGSDVCEHHFANCRMKNGSINKQGMDSCTVNSTNRRANAFNMEKKINTSGDKIRSWDISQPITKVGDRKTYSTVG